MSHHHKTLRRKKSTPKKLRIRKDTQVLLNAFGYEPSTVECPTANGYYSKTLNSVVYVYPNVKPEQLACVILRDYAKVIGQQITNALTAPEFFAKIQKAMDVVPNKFWHQKR